MTRLILPILAFLSCVSFGIAQVSPNCSNAIPICNNTPVNGGTNGFGVDDFNGAAASGCLERTTSGSIESNSAWYYFRTAANGELGINIGHEASEDWDFALYQATDCTNLGEPIRCNFFDNRDQNTYTGIGEDPSGDDSNAQYEDFLQVEPGQDYYLFINNFSNVNSGFSIQFTGNIFVTNPYDALDCSIVSNLLGSPIAACENDNIVLDATTTDAVSYTWYQDTGTGFNELVGETANTITVTEDAIYRVNVLTTMENIISDVQVAFSESPVSNAIDDVVYCFDETNTTFELEVLDSMILGGQNPEKYTVSYHSSLANANAGINALPKAFEKQMGSEEIFVRVTSVDNPDCYDISQSFELNALEVPEITFQEQVAICPDNPEVVIGVLYPNPNFNYMWDSGETSPNLTVSQSGSYTLTISNSSGTESCYLTSTIEVSNSITPIINSIDIQDFQVSNIVTVNTDVTGDFEFQIDNGPFQSSNVFEDVVPGDHTITMRDINGCGELTENFIVAGFTNHFSPNGDVLDETWQVQGLEYLDDPVVSIYDRYGKLLKQLNSPSDSWDGSYEGQPMPSSDYWFRISYLDNSGNRVEAKYVQNHFSLRR